ncbi:copper amine oxidase N-terminal domain-containing protein [Paenibacillus sp. CC-CFT747]|nr:copper amine oxidase N-terminal domain-containing protein [Paenibacillus sp. CC-CFT747]
MKKYVIAGSVLLSSVVGATALADGALKVVVNGSLLGVEGRAELREGVTMAAARPLAEALGAKVTWDNETRTVHIDRPDDKLLQQQISLLESAVAAESAEEAAKQWAEAVKKRNGALQYALMTDELRAQEKEKLEASFWVTGTSSPWVDRYTVSKGTENADGTVNYTITFVYADSTKKESEQQAAIRVKQQEEHWYVAQVPGNPAGEGIRARSFPSIM